MIELFGKTFTPLELTGQIISIAAMIVTVLSFQGKDRTRILLFQIIGNFLFLLSYACVQIWAPVAINVVYITRNTVYMFKNKYKVLDSVWVVALFSVLCVVSVLLTWSEPRDILALIGALFGSVALFMNNEKVMLAIKTGDSLCWLVYNSLTFVTGGILCEICNLASIVIGIIRRGKRQKKESI